MLDMKKVKARQRRYYRSHRKRILAKSKLWKKKNLKKVKKNNRGLHLRKTYGVTLEQFDDMSSKQNNKCAICCRVETAKDCKGRIRPLSIDHDHRINKIRRLLCSRCNAGIGMFDEDAGLLQRAANYLKEYQ